MKKKSKNQRLTKKTRVHARRKSEAIVAKSRAGISPKKAKNSAGESTILTRLQKVEAELALEIETNLKYRSRVGQSQRLAKMGDWERDISTNILNWSDQIYEMTGLSNENPAETYKNFLALIHPEDREAVVSLGARTMREKRPCSQEYRLLRSDGVRRYLHTTSDIIYDSNGNAIKLIGTVQDITEKKLSEIAERDAKSLIEAVIENIPLIIYLKEPANLNYILFNRTGKEIFGFENQEVLGVNHFKPFNNEQRARFMLDDRAILEGAAGVHFYPGEWIMTAQKGMRLFHSQKICIRGEDGSPKYILGIAEDVTEQKEAELQRIKLLAREREAREQAEAASRVKDEFLAVLSHELRTPLTTILGWTQMLNTRKFDEEKSKYGMTIVERSALTLGQLIDDLLDISSLNAGKLNLEVQKLNTEKVLNQAIESCRSLIDTKTIQIECSIDPAAQTLFADPTRIQQILWNLLTNAIKYSPASSKISILVSLDLESPGGQTRIRINDSGNGIRSDFLPHIFENFTQYDNKSTRAHGGLGLGLAIAKKLVASHKGNIRAESAGENLGSSFIVTLPLPIDDAKSLSSSKKILSNLATRSLEGLKILLVEDEPSTREVLTVMLQSFGAEVKSVDSAVEAINEIEIFCPDILISDIAMPNEDGYSLIRKIRSLNSAFAQIPALALTAYADQKDIRYSISAGFHSHLSKPVKRDELATAVLNLKRQHIDKN